MEIIQTNIGMQFTSNEFQEGLSVRGVKLALAASEHGETNDQVEVTWQTLWTIINSIMMYIQVSDEYNVFALIYMTDHIFPVLPIKYLLNQDGEQTKVHTLATGIKLLV